MDAPTTQVAVSGFACRVTATDGYLHLVADTDWAAATAAGLRRFPTLCQLDVQQAPLTAAGEPCEWCSAVANHLELADPMRLDSGRVARFVESLRQAAGAW